MHCRYIAAGAGLAAGLTEVSVQNANGQLLTSAQANFDDLANNLGALPAPTGDWSNVNLTYLREYSEHASLQIHQ